MSLRPELVFVASLLPRRNINFIPTTKGENTMSSSKSRLLQLAEWREERLAARGYWPKRAVAIGMVSTAVIGSGVAFASWSASGTGTAAAKAGTASAVTGVTATTTTSGTLVPGSSVPLVVNIHNPNAFPVTVTAITVSSGAPSGAPGGNCTATSSGVTTTGVSATGLTLVVQPNSDNTYTSPTNNVSMATTSDNSCQGGTFTWSATVTATS